MVTTQIKKVNISTVKLNPDNPRTISKKAMANLVKSLSDFPDMLKLREIVVDETMTVLGGNMRLLALKQIGAKDCTVKIVTGLTLDQKREFIIKDNGSFGEWDMDALASLDDLPLTSWGIDIPGEWTTEPENTTERPPSGLLRKNFNDGMGQDESEEISQEVVYPVTFTLNQYEWETWETAKAKIKIQDDKRAFLRIIGGA